MYFDAYQSSVLRQREIAFKASREVAGVLKYVIFIFGCSLAGAVTFMLRSRA
jgi:acyl-CoA synthetase (AMP-forming)/AMP-acid ligase II